MILRPPISTLFPYTTLFRSSSGCTGSSNTTTAGAAGAATLPPLPSRPAYCFSSRTTPENRLNCSRRFFDARSEEHTSELQSRQYLVCRLLLEKKKKKKKERD